MKTYRLESNPDSLGICNYEKREENIIFNEVISILSNNKTIAIDEPKEYPYCDMANGKCKQGHFVVIYDFNYGTEIKSDSRKVLDYLEQVLNI